MLVLASSSPRRIEMLINAGFDPVVKPASIVEELPFDMNPETATMYLALSKAEAVYSSIKTSVQNGNSDWIPNNEEITILAADTIVVFNGRIIGKPSSKEEAYETLYSMKGTSHNVITGCCMIRFSFSPGNEKVSSKTCFYENTKVFFKNFSSSELRDYVNTDEPYDKAGGYAIQGAFGKNVDHIDGDLDNVIGLPLYRIRQYL